MKPWDAIYNRLLKVLPNPSEDSYVIRTEQPEFTFMGAEGQLDFARPTIELMPHARVIELNALKLYLHQYRTVVLSYERCLNILFDTLMHVYAPRCLRITMECNPRGGIASRLIADSDARQEHVD